MYLDGEYLPAAEARVAAGDAGLLSGRGLFETFRARQGAVYRLEGHFERLRTGARVLGISLPLMLAELRTAVRETTDRSRLEDARVRLTLTAGPENEQASLLIQARPPTDYPEALYQRGMTAIVSPVRRNETSPLSQVKSLNCLDNLLAREEARRSGADTALLLNTQGALAEGCTSNLFLVLNGILLTPPVEDGALPGITRHSILALARGEGIAAHEVSLSLNELSAADEAFLTSAVMGVMPLVAVDGAKAAGNGRPGPLTSRLRTLYETAAKG